MSFPTEYDAFKAYADTYPDGCLLLVDTYDTLHSGVPNAIKIFDYLKANGHKPLGIRLDSGDLAYLSKKARRMLDDAGFTDAVISASNDLDEFLIQSLKEQGAAILIASENMTEIERVCDRILLLDKGRLSYYGSRERLMRRYAPVNEMEIAFAVCFRIWRIFP